MFQCYCLNLSHPLLPHKGSSSRGQGWLNLAFKKTSWAILWSQDWQGRRLKAETQVGSCCDISGTRWRSLGVDTRDRQEGKVWKISLIFPVTFSTPHCRYSATGEHCNILQGRASESWGREDGNISGGTTLEYGGLPQRELQTSSSLCSLESTWPGLWISVAGPAPGLVAVTTQDGTHIERVTSPLLAADFWNTEWRVES